MATAAAVDWSKPWVGPDNHQVGPWGTIANIPKSARWTWHDSGKQKAGKTPLEGGFNHDEFLIFRIPIRYLLPDTLTISNVVEAGCCTVATVVECNCDHVGEAPVDDDPQHDENEPSDTTDIMAEIFATEGIELSDDEHACVMEILSGTFSPDEIRQNLKSPTDEFHKFLLGAVEKCRD